MLEEFKEKLRIELTNKLPGESAHSMMMPTLRDDNLTMPKNQAPPTKSAVLILFYQNEHGHIKFPLIQRPRYNGAHSAQVSFPGGKYEDGDVDLIGTALRESQEEIGIDPKQVEIVGRISDLFIWVSNFLVTPIVSVTKALPNFVRDEKEVDAIIETDLFDILNPEKRKEGVVIAQEKYKIHTPYFDIDNRMVWGATAMMLSELSMVIGKTRIF
jgi:8-oxo-dGTP pyrophosphatase MutT (NUDIX family)